MGLFFVFKAEASELCVWILTLKWLSGILFAKSSIESLIESIQCVALCMTAAKVFEMVQLSI